MFWRRSSSAGSSPELRARSPRQPPLRKAGSDCEDDWEERFDSLLLDVARASIESGLREKRPLTVDCSELPPALRLERATFVTLRREGRLRGCIGALEADSPVAVSVATVPAATGFGEADSEPISGSAASSSSVLYAFGPV